MPDHPLADFTRSSFSHGGETRTLWEQGHGPGIVVMTEMPGITPAVASFARRLVVQGYRVSLPDLFGTAGRELSNRYIATSVVRGCVSREFHAFATHESSPVTRWLRALATDLHERCGGPGVGAIGMCWTGGFALGMMAEPALIAPVLSQPSLPLPVGSKRRRALGLSSEELQVVKDRTEAGCAVLGLRFTHDQISPGVRFARLREELGDAFIGIEVDSSPGNPHGIAKDAHSVVTNDLVDDPDHPTRKALDQLMDFFDQRLKGASA